MLHVGVLGGTFDPIHYGHLAIAEETAWTLRLAHVYLVPAAHQPLKSGQHAATPQQRLHMVELACQDNPLLIPSDLELRRDSPSYTVDTLRALRDTLAPATELWFILGADALMSLPRWRAPEALLHLAYLAVLRRPGVTIDLTTLEAELPGVQARTHLIDGPRLDISSSDVRARIAQGQPVRYQLPEPVRLYIEEHGLYRSQAQARNEDTRGDACAR